MLTRREGTHIFTRCDQIAPLPLFSSSLPLSPFSLLRRAIGPASGGQPVGGARAAKMEVAQYCVTGGHSQVTIASIHLRALLLMIPAVAVAGDLARTTGSMSLQRCHHAANLRNHLGTLSPPEPSVSTPPPDAAIIEVRRQFLHMESPLPPQAPPRAPKNAAPSTTPPRAACKIDSCMIPNRKERWES